MLHNTEDNSYKVVVEMITDALFLSVSIVFLCLVLFHVFSLF